MWQRRPIRFLSYDERKNQTIVMMVAVTVGVMWTRAMGGG